MQTAGSIAAFMAAATFLFAMGLAFTVMAPMADPAIHFETYFAFHAAHKTLIYIWHFAMYLVNGVCLVILAVALYERMHVAAPAIMKVATLLGLMWASFVILSGLIVLYGTEAWMALAAEDPGQGETLKNTLDTITLSIDRSDTYLGCLWVGLVSMAGLGTHTLPKAIALFGILISLSGLIGTGIPGLTGISYVFGAGAILWWFGLGIILLGNNTIGSQN